MEKLEKIIEKADKIIEKVLPYFLAFVAGYLIAMYQINFWASL